MEVLVFHRDIFVIKSIFFLEGMVTNPAIWLVLYLVSIYIFLSLLERIGHCSTRKSTCRLPIYIYIYIYIYILYDASVRTGLCLLRRIPVAVGYLCYVYLFLKCLKCSTLYVAFRKRNIAPASQLELFHCCRQNLKHVPPVSLGWRGGISTYISYGYVPSYSA